MSIFVGNRQVLDILGSLNENFVSTTKSGVFDQMKLFSYEYTKANLIGEHEDVDQLSSQEIVKRYAENLSPEEFIMVIEYDDIGNIMDIILNNSAD